MKFLRSSLLAFFAALSGSAAFAATISGFSGQSATFAATASGTAPFTYQWMKNGVAISGATSASYSIATLSTSDSADYTVTVSNSVGSAVSAVTTLSVSDPVIAPTLSSQPVGQTVNVGQSVSFSVTASGSSLSYQWMKNGVAIAGANAASFSIASAALTDAGDYSVVVSNSAGSLTSSTASLVVNQTQQAAPVAAPVISAQPASLLIISGKSASFSVTASGSSLAYQWMKNGVAIAGASSSSFTIASVASTDAANYSVIVSNSGGAISSATATLSIEAAATYNRITNVSVRAVLEAANTSSVVGFSSAGLNTRRFLVRGVGPSLAQYGFSNVLTAAVLEIHTTVNGVDTIIASNSQWSSDSNNATAFIEAGAFPLTAGSNDAAVVIEVPAGDYTAVLTGANGALGTALVEIYELP